MKKGESPLAQKDYLCYSQLHNGPEEGESNSRFANDFGLDQPLRVEAGKKGVWGEVFAGAGFTFCDQIYLGGRVGVNFSDLAVRASSTCTVLEAEEGIAFSLLPTLKMNCVEPTLDFKPGIIFCRDTMLFGLVGAAFNRVKLSTDLKVVGVGDEAMIVIPVGATKDVVGVRVGGGLEYLWCCHYGLQVSYVYAFYPEESFRRTVTMESVEFALRSKARPARQVASIGLAYYF